MSKYLAKFLLLVVVFHAGAVCGVHCPLINHYVGGRGAVPYPRVPVQEEEGCGCCCPCDPECVCRPECRCHDKNK